MSDKNLTTSKLEEFLQKIADIKSELAGLEDKMDKLSNEYYYTLIDLQKVCTHKMFYQRGEYFCTICMLTSRVRIDNKNDAEEE
jgi:hypothetical protein|tara:strand:+ start:614 stop:865 length:252 start_codon:yes stop_codon:yes gene_type:complete